MSSRFPISLMVALALLCGNGLPQALAQGETAAAEPAQKGETTKNSKKKKKKRGKQAGAGDQHNDGRASAGETAAALDSEETKPDPQFANLLRAVSGRRCNKKDRLLLSDVVQIARVNDQIVLTRSGGGKSDFFPRGTTYGDKMLGSLDEAETKARRKFGAPAAEWIHNLSALKLDGARLEVQRTGPQEVVVSVPRQHRIIPVHVKEIRLGKITADIKERDGYPALRNIQGIRAVVRTTGIDLPIDLREFGRYKDDNGNTHLTFGIQSWIPKPLRSMMGLPDVVPFKFVVPKKKDKDQDKERQSGQDESAAAETARPGDKSKTDSAEKPIDSESAKQQETDARPEEPAAQPAQSSNPAADN